MIEIGLFGGARIYDRDRQVMLTEFNGVKPRQVLQLLALNGGHPLPKERLADKLWQGEPPASWLSTLEGYVSLLRRGLQAGTAARDSVVLTRSGGYALDRSRVSVDLDRFDSLVAAAEQQPHADDQLSGLLEALSLVRGEVLEGERAAAWIADVRLCYRRRVRRAVVSAGRLALRLERIADAVRLGQWACDLDPLAEDGWEILIEAYWRDGRRTDALRSFREVQRLLDAELGITPCRALRQLQTAVLRDDPAGLPA
jgi:DNA-binding SARP family transcriptional activator